MLDRDRLRALAPLALGVVCCGVPTAIGIFSAAPASAQEDARQPQGQEDEQPPQVVAVEEITVTAQKREEALQEVPISITAFTGETLERIVATELVDITQRTPNFHYTPQSDLKLSFPTIRGIRSAGGSGAAAPTVGFYVDQVFLGNNLAAQFDLYDIERIEVLRGPQGTLFGRNTIGGVVNVVTSQPERELGGSFDLLAGNYDYTRGRLSVTGPLGAAVAAKISAVYNLRDEGFVDNVFDGTTGNDTENSGVRGELSLLPSDNAVVRLTADWRSVRQHSKYFDILGPSPLFDALLGTDFDRDPFDRRVSSNVRSEEDLDGWGATAIADVSFDRFALTSVTSYREHDYFNRGDTDMSPLDWVTDGDPEEQSQVSQELRLTSTTGGPIDWIGGVYWFHQDFDNSSYVEFRDDFNGLILGLPPGLVLFDVARGDVATDSWAGFGHVTYHATDRLDVALGARYTIDEKEIDYLQTSETGFFPEIPLVTASDDWDAFTPALSVDFQATDDLMTYLTVSRGFKSGGYNQGLGEGPLTAAIPFDPEYLWNYEIGLKSSWLRRRIVLDLAVFEMDWSDIQIITDDPSTPLFDPITLNAAEAHSRGLELGLTARPSQALAIEATGGLLDAEYDADAPAAGVSAGNDLSAAPESSFGLSLELTPRIGDHRPLAARLESQWQGDQFLTADNQPDGLQGSYSLINARVAWDFGGGWSVALWGKNLDDEVYLTRLFDLSDNPLVSHKLVALGPPRTYGLEVRYDF